MLTNDPKMKKTEALKKKPGNFSSRVGKMYQADIPPLCYRKMCALFPNSYSPNREDGKFRNLKLKPEVLGNDKIINDNLDSSADSSLGVTWTDLEEESLLLGMYIFPKKDFILLKKFIGTNKEVRDIQRFYYGKFYGNEGNLRLLSSKKCAKKLKISPPIAVGEKIFTGWRHEKLFARFFSLASKDLHDALVQSSLNFSRGKLSFKDYIFTLRNIVGIKILVKAVGIGQGKEDLTNAYYSLTNAKIIMILKGNLRLRKSQFEDIFWKAVWPRLLAKGWHSERVKDHKTLGLDQSFVFLVYDVHKFSSRLVQGEQYFDSVTDVLNKVASEPMILGSRRKQALEPGRKKFTVVDTSTMLDEAKSLELRKVRNLPAQITSVDNVEIPSEKSEDNAENISGNGTCHESTNGLEPVMEAMKDQESPAKKHLITGMKDLTTCNNHENSNCRAKNMLSLERNTMEEESTCHQSRNSSSVSSLGKGDNRDGSNGGIVHDARLDGEITSVKSPPQKHTFDLNIPYVSPETETDMTQNNYGSHEKRIPIDLNIPCIDMLQNNGDSDMKKSSSPSQETRQNIPRTLNLLSDNVTSEDNQPVLDTRRKSIRERPMTKRALEALEDEFSNTRTWKRVKVPSQKNSKA